MSILNFHEVTVQYPIYNSRSLSLRNQLVRFSTGGRIEREAGNVQIITALKAASFQLENGDAVGLIGHNGAGKSTLLRTMAGVYTPVSGTIERQGRIATVLEPRAGMSPELSGYENITRMCLLMGMSLQETRAVTADIEAFTQLGNFLHLPVRTYSSGMSTRLAFAVATSNWPDILLVDEIFGAGDAEFRHKAKDRMEKLISSVGIFVFASHDHKLVKEYCNRFFQLRHGNLTEITADEIVD